MRAIGLNPLPIHWCSLFPLASALLIQGIEFSNSLDVMAMDARYAGDGGFHATWCGALTLSSAAAHHPDEGVKVVHVGLESKCERVHEEDDLAFAQIAKGKLTRDVEQLGELRHIVGSAGRRQGAAGGHHLVTLVLAIVVPALARQ